MSDPTGESAAEASGSLPAWPVRRRDRCGLCDDVDLNVVLTLPAMPAATAFAEPASAGRQARYPVAIGQCAACGHVQLLDLLPPERLFGRAYVADGASPLASVRARRRADQLLAETAPSPGALIIEVGCNDGTLLKECEDRGLRVHGIEPAVDVAGLAMQRGLHVFAGFLAPAIAERIEEERGRAAVVHAGAALATTEDVGEWLAAVLLLLARDGLFTFSVPYLGAIVQARAVTAFGHGRFAYHALGPLLACLRAHDLDVIAVSVTDGHLHGLAQRTGGARGADGSVATLLAEEERLALDRPRTWADLAATLPALTAAVRGHAARTQARGGRCFGWRASLAATTLLAIADVGADTMTAILDPEPSKHGLAMPGVAVPIMAPEAMPPGAGDLILLLDWLPEEGDEVFLARARAIGAEVIAPLSLSLAP